MDFTIFDHLKNLTINKIPYDEKNDVCVKNYNIYRINRIISMVECFLPLANALNRCPNIKKKDHYQVLLSALPKRKQFFEYIKKPKDIDKQSEKLVAKYFEFGTRDLEVAMKMLDEEHINEIVGKYDCGRK